ncbi:pentapeptide repeat-containing protein [Dactylosporangium sucinum]|uniref:Pentapeptide repeat-containing protein n=1 Tax=Dactylosporangium sucinum TaxID=1424081 RepID=A0A917WN26_9ACTN|nr:pentapeptide repeat-containing protein [Dactylosporangium sucinum]GGM16474.1 hypothetical protein GCM10007977_017210 [Dactylosporangium sucinum]
MLVATMSEQPSAITPNLEAGHPLLALRERLRLLHLRKGKPSSREIHRRTERAISHTTASAVLRCEKNPRWGQLELVVEALDGDLEEFRPLWMAAEEAKTAQSRVAVDSDQATPADLDLGAPSRSAAEEQSEVAAAAVVRARQDHRPPRRKGAATTTATAPMRDRDAVHFSDAGRRQFKSRGEEPGVASVNELRKRYDNGERTFWYAELDGADLRGTNLEGVSFYCSSLIGVNMDNLNLTHVQLKGANLSGATMRGVDLVSSDSIGADFRDVDLSGSNLTGTHF